MLDDMFAADGSLDISARIGGKIDDDAAGPHACDLTIVDQARRRPSRDQRGGDHNILFGNMR